MTKPFLVPFRAEHMFAFVPRTNIPLEMRFGLANENGGPAFTAVLDEKIIGCAGINLLWPGVGAAWVAFGKEIEDHGLWATRTVRAVLRDTVRSFNLHRVEAVVYAENHRDARWIRLLGFRKENDIAQMYTSDKRDVVRFELIS